MLVAPRRLPRRATITGAPPSPLRHQHRRRITRRPAPAVARCTGGRRPPLSLALHRRDRFVPCQTARPRRSGRPPLSDRPLQSPPRRDTRTDRSTCPSRLPERLRAAVARPERRATRHPLSRRRLDRAPAGAPHRRQPRRTPTFASNSPSPRTIPPSSPTTKPPGPTCLTAAARRRFARPDHGRSCALGALLESHVRTRLRTQLRSSRTRHA